jgi:hypothetical protein
MAMSRWAAIANGSPAKANVINGDVSVTLRVNARLTAFGPLVLEEGLPGGA